MSLIAEFMARLPADLRTIFQSFEKPIDIQQYLDGLSYVGEERDRCPLDVMKDKQCHCLDGGLFAALALQQIGDPGLLIDLVPTKNKQGEKLDDDHVLAVYRRHGLWGAVAKSNFPWLRYREPVYRNLHELVMSYFEVYFSINAIKVLHGYTRPFNIAHYDHLNYAWDESGATELYQVFYRREEIPLITKKAEALLQPVDPRAYKSGTLGVNWDWVYHPKEHN